MSNGLANRSYGARGTRKPQYQVTPTPPGPVTRRVRGFNDTMSTKSTTSQSGDEYSAQITRRRRFVPMDIWYKILPFLSLYDLLTITYACSDLYDYVTNTLVLDPLCLNAFAGADWLLHKNPVISKVVARSLQKASCIIIQADNYHSCYALTPCIASFFSGTAVMTSVKRFSLTLSDSRYFTSINVPILCMPNCRDIWLALYNLPSHSRTIRLACPRLRRIVVSEELILEGLSKHAQVVYLTNDSEAAHSPLVRSSQVHFASGPDGTEALCEPIPEFPDMYLYRTPAERETFDEYYRENPPPSPKLPLGERYVWNHADDKVAYSSYLGRAGCLKCYAFAQSFEQMGLAPRHRPRAVPHIHSYGRQQEAYLPVFETYHSYSDQVRAEALEERYQLKPKRANLRWEFVRSSDNTKCNKVLDQLISAIGSRTSRVPTQQDVLLVASSTRDFIRWSISAQAERIPRKIAYVLIANEPVDTQEIQNVYMFAQKHVGCVRIFWQRLRYFPPEYARVIAELMTGQLEPLYEESPEPWVKSFPGVPLYYVPEPFKSQFIQTIWSAIRQSELPYTGCVRFQAYPATRRESMEAFTTRLMRGQTRPRIY